MAGLPGNIPNEGSQRRIAYSQATDIVWGIIPLPGSIRCGQRSCGGIVQSLLHAEDVDASYLSQIEVRERGWFASARDIRHRPSIYPGTRTEASKPTQQPRVRGDPKPQRNLIWSGRSEATINLKPCPMNRRTLRV